LSDATHAQKRIARALRLVTVPFPHLSGLVAAAQVTMETRLPTMGVFASGRLIANPSFVAKLKDPELVFVLAHEMLHLALRTHDRARGANRMHFNVAHDYIINDMLRAELGVETIPAGGLDMPGARTRSAEEIMLEMRRNGQASSRRRVWGDGPADGEPGDGGDVLADELERELYPDDDATKAKRAAERMRALAARSLALAEAFGALRGMRGLSPGSSQHTVTRCAASTARRGISRCSAGWPRSRRASGHSRGRRDARACSRTSCCPAAPARVAPERRARHQRVDERRDPQGARRDRGLLRRRGRRPGAARTSATPR
jgi:hypothetical protein